MPFAVIKTEKTIAHTETRHTEIVAPDFAVVEKSFTSREKATKYRDQQPYKERLIVIEYW